MNLKYFIRSDKKYESKGTGVFIRNSEGTRELQTIDEIKTYYPDFDFSNIVQEYYESYDVWKGEITHNLAYLASYIKVGNTSLYTLLWKPEDIGMTYLNKLYVAMIKEAVEEIKKNVDLNKYGSESEISELLNFIQPLYNCISSLNINYSDEFKIISER